MNKHILETRWADFVIKNPKRVIVCSLIMVAILATGIFNASMSSDYRYFFGEDNPQRQAFDSLQKIYSKDDSVLMTITPEDGRVFKSSTIEGLRYLTEQAWKLPYVTRVDSITNFQHSYAEEDDLVVKDLITRQDLENVSESDMEFLRETAMQEPQLLGRLISEDTSVTGINIKMTFPGESPFETPDAAQSARDLADDFIERFPGHKTHLSGMVMLNDAFNEAGLRDITTLMPVMYLLITVVLFFVLRTIAGVATTLGVMLLSIVGAMGFSGWMSIPITPPSSMAPTVIMTLAIAHSIHFLKSTLKNMASAESRHEAIRESMRQNFKPIFLTSLTTIVGFLSLNFSDTPPFHDLGNITAVGVALSWFLSLGFLPAIISNVDIKAPAQKPNDSRIVERYSKWVEQNKYPVIIVMAIVTAFLGMQIKDMRISDEFVGYFDESIRFRPDSEYTIENLTGVYMLNFDIRAGASQGINAPDYLHTLDSFANYLRSVPDVVHVSSISDTYKRLNMNMNGDRPDEYRLPNQRDIAAQYLLLFEMSLPYGLDLNSLINVDKSATRLVVTLGEVETSRILEVSKLASAWLEKNAPPEMYAEATSPTVMFSQITERNIQAMILGTVIALTLITLVLTVSLGSLEYGLISLLPNVIPATIAIGLWSLLVGEAGFSIAFVASVTLGIIVDDTVHFLSKFSYAKRNGQSTADSVTYALRHVGSALMATSLVLVVGFSVLMFSGFKLNFVLGALSALTIAVALAVDFTLLPALLNISPNINHFKERYLKMKYVMFPIIGMVVLITAFISFDVSANTTQNIEKGRSIAAAADQFDQGFVNQTADVTMILENSHGQRAERQLRIKILEVQGDGDKSITIFDSPADVKGTSFLSFSHAQEQDEQWLYLPSLKRVKRISSNNKSGPFMGSEFAYEDLSSQELDKYTYLYIEPQSVLGQPGHVIERRPVDPNSGYTKQRMWIDATYWRPEKIEFYDRKNELLKTVKYLDYQEYPNRKWRPDTMVMKNHQTGKSTTLSWKNISFGTDLSTRDFDRNALKRVR